MSDQVGNQNVGFLMTAHFLFFRDEIGVLEQVSGTSVSALIHHQIQHHVETTCKGNFETAYLEILETVFINEPSWDKTCVQGLRPGPT